MLQTITSATEQSLPQFLNKFRNCIVLDREYLADEDASDAVRNIWKHLPQSHPHLLTSNPVFLSKSVIARMLQTATAIEAVTRHPNYLAHVLPDNRLPDFGTAGVMMGYDFHVTPSGPKLIEVNTNAGGAFINHAALKAHRACCNDVEKILTRDMQQHFPRDVADMFRREWTRQGRTHTLRHIVIVDKEPTLQFLYPEFLLAKELLERQGFGVSIADPRDLSVGSCGLELDGRQVDLVYNRLTDFALIEPDHIELRNGYIENKVVVTPNPFHHASLAHKSNLVFLSDIDLLRRIGIPNDIIAALNTIPRAHFLNSDTADILWKNRRSFVFKPTSGFGSKAVYRGDKIAKARWEAISRGSHIAQEYVEPETSAHDKFKMDIRLYTYDGKMLLAAARLYQGQTTNFRTPGGGFAPVIAV